MVVDQIVVLYKVKRFLSELIQVELKIPLFNFEFPALGGSRQQLTEFSAEASREEEC